MANGETQFDDTLARSVTLPTGERQTLTVRVVGAELTVALNGTEITRASGIVERAGHIGLQGETGTLEFRSLRLRDLSSD